MTLSNATELGTVYTPDEIARLHSAVQESLLEWIGRLRAEAGVGFPEKVTAFRLFTRGTVEEKIWELQQKKAALAREILGEESFARSLTREDLEWLLDPA